MKKPLITLCLAVCLAACQGPPSAELPAQPASPPPPAVVALTAADHANAQELLNLVNRVRLQQGVGPLALDDRLCLAAKVHALDVAKMTTPSHTGSDGSKVGQRATAAGYRWQMVGENIATSTGDMPAAEAMEGWLKSPGHRANLLHPSFIHMGAARAGNIWVQVFALPSSD